MVASFSTTSGSNTWNFKSNILLGPHVSFLSYCTWCLLCCISYVPQVAGLMSPPLWSVLLWSFRGLYKSPVFAKHLLHDIVVGVFCPSPTPWDCEHLGRKFGICWFLRGGIWYLTEPSMNKAFISCNIPDSLLDNIHVRKFSIQDLRTVSFLWFLLIDSKGPLESQEEVSSLWAPDHPSLIAGTAVTGTPSLFFGLTD